MVYDLKFNWLSGSWGEVHMVKWLLGRRSLNDNVNSQENIKMRKDHGGYSKSLITDRYHPQLSAMFQEVNYIVFDSHPKHLVLVHLQKLTFTAASFSTIKSTYY